MTNPIGHDVQVTAYTGFARFYDRIMGDRTEEIDRIRRYIGKHPVPARLLVADAHGGEDATAEHEVELAGLHPVA